MKTSGKKSLYLDFLKAQKLKLTWQREAILDLLLSHEEPFSLHSLSQKSWDLGIKHESTVYRVLTSFSKAGILEEFTLPGKKQTRYSLTTPGAHKDHHHHIVCNVCGDVDHIQQCLPKPYLGDIEKLTGYSVTEHTLEFRGICKSCHSVKA